MIEERFKVQRKCRPSVHRTGWETVRYFKSEADALAWVQRQYRRLPESYRIVDREKSVDAEHVTCWVG